MDNKINDFLNSNGSFDIDISESFEINDSNGKNLKIYYSSFDYDIYMFPNLENKNNKIIFSELFFSFKDFPIFSKSLIVLANAIENETNNNKKLIEVDSMNSLMDDFIKNINTIEIPKESEYFVLSDDFSGNFSSGLKVNINSQGVSLIVQDIDGVRFRHSIGGGKKFKVRNSLKFICYLISKNIK
jgi:hypothetical protein